MNTSVRSRRVAGIIGALSLLLPLLACGNLNAPAPEPEPGTTTDPVVQDTPTAEPAAGGVCSRVQACCQAYVATMGNGMPASTCDAYANAAQMPEAACASAMSGYRQGLTALGHEVPADCAE